MASRSYGQYCGVTTAVELIGERWAMLIVRDLLVGPRRYTDLKQGLPRIPTNILSTRLKELQEGGVVRRVPLMNCGLVYELTPYGRELEQIVLALGRWGFAAMGEPAPDDVVTADSFTMALRTAFRPDAAAALPAADYEVHVGDVALRVQVDGRAVRVAQLAPLVGGAAPPGEPDIVFAAGPGIRHLISGALSPAQAVDDAVVRVVRGDATLLERFADTFHIDGRITPMTRGRIVIDLFTTLDGVAQAPGGPDEDTSGGFRFGGWQAPLPDTMVGEQVDAYIHSMDALLLGRRTYDIFAGYWPQHTDGPEGFIGRTFDAVPKYVASRRAFEPGWAGTTRIGDDIVAEVDALRDRHTEIHVVGSVDFVQTLLGSQVYDELRLWVHPVVLGQGKRVFPDGAAPSRMRLIEPPLTGDGGVVQLRYAPVDGEPETGEM